MQKLLILPKKVIKVCKALSTIGKFITFGFAFYLVALFYIAYLSPDKGVVFLINQLGEARFEYYMMSGCVFLMIFYFAWSSLYTEDVPVTKVDTKKPSNMVLVPTPGLMKTHVLKNVPESSDHKRG